jgi:GNAT superfamily N-acetyltransferase
VELIIRPAQPPDVEAIAGVHVRSWQIGHQADYPKHVVESVSVGERSQGWQKALRDPSAEKTVLIAEIDGVVVGFISSGPVRGAIDDAARTGEVYELFVDPASFGRGVGTALIGADAGSGITLVERAFHPFQALFTYQASGGRCSQVRDPNHHFPGKARTPLGIERLGPVG